MKKQPIYMKNAKFLFLLIQKTMTQWLFGQLKLSSINMSNYDKFQKTINAHQNKIDCLKYNDNDDIENKEFIIFFRKR